MNRKSGRGTPSKIWVLFGLCPSLACAWGAPPAPSGVGLLESAQRMYDSGRYEAVLSELSPQRMQKLRSADLKKAYLLQGLSYQSLGKSAQALGVFQLAAGLFPKDIDLLSRLASLLHRVRLEERAQPLYERILDIHPNNALAHLGLAEIASRHGLLERSAAHYEKCLEEWKDNPEIWLSLARVHARRRFFAQALNAAERALALSPGDADALLFLASLQHDQGLHQEALQALERVSVAASSDTQKSRRLSLQAALWLLETGDLEGGLSRIQTVLRDSPKHPLALWIRARIFLKRGRNAQAIQDLLAAASCREQAPFVAAVSGAALKELAGPRE